MTTYRMYKDSERELCFPLAVSVSYQNGDRGKHGEVVRGYAACDLAGRTPTQIEHCYRKRSAIESSYRLFRSAPAVTTTQDPIARFAFMVVSFLLENLWLVLRWAVVARPRRGGRDLPEEFTFTVFCDWIRHALEEELERRWKIKMNDVGVPDAYTSAAGLPQLAASGKSLREHQLSARFVRGVDAGSIGTPAVPSSSGEPVYYDSKPGSEDMLRTQLGTTDCTCHLGGVPPSTAMVLLLIERSVQSGSY